MLYLYTNSSTCGLFVRHHHAEVSPSALIAATWSFISAIRGDTTSTIDFFSSPFSRSNTGGNKCSRGTCHKQNKYIWRESSHHTITKETTLFSTLCWNSQSCGSKMQFQDEILLYPSQSHYSSEHIRLLNAGSTLTALSRSWRFHIIGCCQPCVSSCPWL